MKKKIRFMRFKGSYHRHVVIFAKGTLCQNIYLRFRGYRRHETIAGTIMMRKYMKGINNE